MKNVLLISTALILAFASYAQPDHKKSPHDTVSTKDIKVTYGRPYKKGRVIFGGLQKYGEVWRCGADEATEITFSKDGTFGGRPVKAGSYTLFVTPNEKEWTIILNGDPHFWGTQYEQHKTKDVLHVNVAVKNLSTAVEQLTIHFAGGDMIIEWDKTQVAVPVKV
ncbi:MAG TPA: DUF2911 domain-containing protein [Puia sp.]|jgi:hypothetical protein|nr:DUF2911 domain-containing protein [Puia sp.]